MKWLTNMDKCEITKKAEYLKGKVIGEPLETYKYTVEQLRGFGIVGVYERDLAARAGTEVVGLVS